MPWDPPSHCLYREPTAVLILLCILHTVMEHVVSYCIGPCDNNSTIAVEWGTVLN